MNKTICISIVFVLFLTGCSSADIMQKRSYEKKECELNRGIKEYYDYDVDYMQLADLAVNALFETASTEPKNFIVTDFVDLTSLQNYSKLGYIFSNAIKNSLIQKYHAKVVEAEISKYFEISGNGLRVLSRNFEQLRQDRFNLNRVIVGTYTYTDEEIIIFVKLIDLKTGIIEGSYAKKLPMTCEMMYLLTQK